MAKTNGFPQKTPHPIPHQKCFMFKSSFSNDKKIISPHPILNTQQKQVKMMTMMTTTNFSEIKKTGKK